MKTAMLQYGYTHSNRSSEWDGKGQLFLDYENEITQEGAGHLNDFVKAV